MSNRISLLGVLVDPRCMKVEYKKANEVYVAEGYTVQDLIDELADLKAFLIKDKINALDTNIKALNGRIDALSKAIDVIKLEYDIKQLKEE